MELVKSTIINSEMSENISITTPLPQRRFLSRHSLALFPVMHNHAERASSSPSPSTSEASERVGSINVT